MEKERKIKCHCKKAVLEEKVTDFDSFKAKALVCPSCKFTTLTQSQAKEYIKLKNLHEAVDKESKVIKIGNSMGIILSEKLKNFGVKLGKKVKISAINSNAIKIEF